VTRTCSICSHAAREEIDAALVRRVSYRRISGRYSVSESALGRHLNDHLAEYVHKALREYGQEKGIRVLTKLGSMVDRLEAFLDRAEEEEDGAEFRATAAELRKQLELVSKLQGELEQEGTVNVDLHPEYLKLEAVIISTLENYPDAFDAVHAAIKRVNASEGHALARG
jgi:hypothetical protein